MLAEDGDEHPTKSTPNARSSAEVLAMRNAFIESDYETSIREGSRRSKAAFLAIDASQSLIEYKSLRPTK